MYIYIYIYTSLSIYTYILCINNAEQGGDLSVMHRKTCVHYHTPLPAVHLSIRGCCHVSDLVDGDVQLLQRRFDLERVAEGGLVIAPLLRGVCHRSL